MKKKYIIPGLLAAVSVVGLAACDNEDKDAKTISDLEISGYTENFTVGDSFAKGELKVEAKYSDDSVVDVTNDENLKITAPTSLSEPGTYAVIVSYGGLSEAYQIKVKSSSVGGETPVVTVKDLTITGAKTDFVVGDTFATTGLTVEAKYSDDTTKDVTSDEDVKIEGPTSLNQVGSYSVLVSFGGVTKAYQIQVSDVHRTLDSIEVNTTGTKLSYVAGVAVDDISTDVSLNYIYEDDNQVQTIEVVTDLSGYTKAIKDAAGNAVTGTISEAGTYTVTLSKGDDTASFDIVVTPDVSSVGKALAVGVANQAYVKSGNTTITQSNESDEDAEYYSNVEGYTEYEFGKDYYFAKDYVNGENVTQGHIFIYENEIYGITAYPNFNDPTLFDNLQAVDRNTLSEDSFKGQYFYEFGFEQVKDADGNEKLAYGTDGLLENLYYFGSKNPNGDFKESVEHNAGYDTYHFSFSYFNEIYETFSVYNVSFNLGDDYIFDNVRIIKNNYVKKLIVDKEGNPIQDSENNYVYDYQYVKNEKTGHYSISDNAPSRGDNYYTVYIDQVSGERDLEPTYTGDQFIAESFTIKDSTGKELHDGDTIQAELGKNVELSITPAPTIDSWLLDAPKFDSPILYTYYSELDDKIFITTSSCGEFEIEIKTTNCLMTLNVVIPKANPDSMVAQQFLANEDNPNQAAYTDDISTVKTATNTPIYLVGIPKANESADNTDASKYSMSLVGDATGCKLQQVERSYQDGKISVWEFQSAAAGTYSIEVCSTIEGCEDIKTIITVEIVDISSIDLAKDVLNGSYTYTDPNYQYEDLAVEFTPESEGALTGTVTLHTSYTTRMGKKVDFDAAYTYQVDADTKVVTLTKVSSSEEATISMSISEYYDIVLNLSFGSVWVDNAILKKAEPVVELSFSEAWQGTWSGEDNTNQIPYKLNVSAKEATFYENGDLVSGTYAFQSENVLVLTSEFMGDIYTYTFTLSDTTITYTDPNKNNTELTKSAVAEDKYPAAMQGTWTGTDSNGKDYKLVVSANEARFYVYDELYSDSTSVFELQSSTILLLKFPDWNETHTFELDGTSIIYTSAAGDTVTLERIGDAEEPATVTIPEAWIGTYTFTGPFDVDGDGVNETEATHTLVISSTGATYTMVYNDQTETYSEVLEVTADQIVISNGSPFFAYTFTVNVADSTVTDYNGNVYTKMGR